MSLEDIRRLLCAHHITPKRFLGQNFLIEPSLYRKMSEYAELNKSDVVLDAGAGFGFLTRFLSNKCKTVVAVEKDLQVAKILKEQTKDLDNVLVIEGDVLKAELPTFNKVVAIPPYYLSSLLVTWILEKRVDLAVMILQKEFSHRLVATVGSEDYGWLTVVASQCAKVELFDAVPKEMFHPSPEVDSVILVLKHQNIKNFEVKNEVVFVRLVKWLFTQRNKKLAKALRPYIKTYFKFCKSDAEKIALNIPFHNKRVRELSPQDFGEIANALPD
jgi:16S rRNA (adenine1518-N6/adenine1519-N6)-dimethyltransferase